MEIIIINGSPREKGLTSSILHTIEKRLANKGAEVVFYDLINLKMKQCCGCCSCYTTGKCIYNDDAENLSLEIANANGLVMGSPTYASNISGILKQFIERGHFVIEQLLLTNMLSVLQREKTMEVAIQAKYLTNYYPIPVQKSVVKLLLMRHLIRVFIMKK